MEGLQQILEAVGLRRWTDATYYMLSYWESNPSIIEFCTGGDTMLQIRAVLLRGIRGAKYYGYKEDVIPGLYAANTGYSMGAHIDLLQAVNNTIQCTKDSEEEFISWARASER